MDLEQFSVPPEAGQITIKQATRDDLNILRHHPESGEKIFHSALTFWDVYGFRSLFLGYLKGEPDPSIFQYVLDHTANPIYRKMVYGGMYLQQSPTSVQVENLYAFREKRRKNIALKFEWALFGFLKNTGKKQVRTHIEEHNLPTIGWAGKVGLKPDAWVTMVLPDLPILRSVKPQFVYSPIRDRGQGRLQELLLPGSEWGMGTTSGHCGKGA